MMERFHENIWLSLAVNYFQSKISIIDGKRSLSSKYEFLFRNNLVDRFVG